MSAGAVPLLLRWREWRGGRGVRACMDRSSSDFMRLEAPAGAKVCGNCEKVWTVWMVWEVGTGGRWEVVQ